MGDLNRVNFQLQNGYLPRELNYTGYYNTAEFLSEKYAFCNRLQYFDDIIASLAENLKQEGKTPLDELLERQNKKTETNNIENGIVPDTTMCEKRRHSY